MGPTWDFAVAPRRPVPGVCSMVGYRAGDIPDSVHAGLPSAQLTFVISLDDGVRATFEPAALTTTARKRVLVAGLHTRPSHVEQSAGQAGIQLAVHPLAARSLFGVPAAALAGIDVDGDDLLGRRSAELVDRLGAADPLWDTRFDEVGEALRRQLARVDGSAVRPELWQAWEALTRSGGNAPIPVVARAAGVSTRHLSTLFRAEVGLTPKAVAGLIRFETVIGSLGRLVRAGSPVDLAQLAVERGYADQAHLTRDFTRFAGSSPLRWLRTEFRNLQDGGHSRDADSTS